MYNLFNNRNSRKNYGNYNSNSQNGNFQNFRSNVNYKNYINNEQNSYFNRNEYWNANYGGRNNIKEEIREAILDIKEGIYVVLVGLNYFADCNCCKGNAAINFGLCFLKEGFCELNKLLSRICFKYNFEAKCLIEQGLREICDGIKEIERGQRILNCGNFCAGAEVILCGIERIENGLCDIIKGLECLR